MKHFLIFFMVLALIIAVGAVAQTTNETTTTESTKVPHVYPVAAGVWYPGDPLPEKPVRYYRIRCWPGCHHGGSPYAKYPDLPETAEAETKTESTKVPRTYPIAAGVWYPGESLPEKPSRYYRIRCWPGCHHGGSPYAKYPDKQENTSP
jgi:hypothetical protein